MSSLGEPRDLVEVTVAGNGELTFGQLVVRPGTTRVPRAAVERARAETQLPAWEARGAVVVREVSGSDPDDRPEAPNGRPPPADDAVDSAVRPRRRRRKKAPEPEAELPPLRLVPPGADLEASGPDLPGPGEES